MTVPTALLFILAFLGAVQGSQLPSLSDIMRPLEMKGNSDPSLPESLMELEMELGEASRSDETAVKAANLNKHVFSLFQTSQGADMVVIMADCDKLSPDQFTKAKKFAKELIDNAMTSGCKYSPQVAVMSHRVEYSNFGFTSPVSRAAVKAAIDTITNDRRKANTEPSGVSRALAQAYRMLKESRAGAKKVIFVLGGKVAGELVNRIGERLNINVFSATVQDNSDIIDDHFLVAKSYEDLVKIAEHPMPKMRCNAIDLARYRADDFRSLINAFISLKHKGVINTMAAIHEQTYYNPWGDQGSHMDDGIWPWHRSFLSSIEYALQLEAGDSKLRLVYWDWSGEDVDGAEIWTYLGEEQNGDPTDHFCVNTGYFNKTAWHPDSSECVRRNFNVLSCGRQMNWDQLNQDICLHPYHQFRPTLEGGGHRHNLFHNKMGGDMPEQNSPRDPIFYFHHCFLDRMWYLWQQKWGTGPEEYETAPGAQYTIDFKMAQLNALHFDESANLTVPLLHNVNWTYPRNVLVAESMGYFYSSEDGPEDVCPPENELSFTNSIVEPFQAKLKGLTGAEKLFRVLEMCRKGSQVLSKEELVACARSGELKWVRLVSNPGNSKSRFEGQVQVLIYGEWKNVNSERFGANEANTICGHLGYSTGTPKLIKAKISTKTSVVALKSEKCTSSFLPDCLTYLKNSDAIQSFAGVKCQPGVRVVPSGSYGTVEVFDSSSNPGQWGAVCAASEWGLHQATMVCTLAGKGPAEFVEAGGSSKTMQGCLLSSNRLADCDGIEWGRHDCPTSSSQLKVKCGKTIRLVDPASGSDGQVEGRVEVFNRGVWGRVCSENWGDEEAAVACRQAGFPSSGTPLTTPRSLWRGPSVIWMDGVQCEGEEASLSDCAHNGYARNLCRDYDDAAVRCIQQ